MSPVQSLLRRTTLRIFWDYLSGIFYSLHKIEWFFKEFHNIKLLDYSGSRGPKKRMIKEVISNQPKRERTIFQPTSSNEDKEPVLTLLIDKGLFHDNSLYSGFTDRMWLFLHWDSESFSFLVHLFGFETVVPSSWLTDDRIVTTDFCRTSFTQGLVIVNYRLCESDCFELV